MFAKAGDQRILLGDERVDLRRLAVEEVRYSVLPNTIPSNDQNLWMALGGVT